MQLPDDLQHISPAITTLTLRYPHVSYFMWARCKIASADWCPVAATDGRTIFINPEGIAAYALPAQVFILAHEVSHCVFEHPWLKKGWHKQGAIGGLPYDEDTLQRAMDFVINDFLVVGKVGKCPPEGLHDKAIGTFEDSVPEVYARLYKKNNSQSNSGKSGSGGTGRGAGGGSPQDGKEACAGASDVREPATDQPGPQHKAEVRRSYAMAKARGKLPAGLERKLEDATRSNVDFRQVIPRFLEGSLGKTRRSFKRPDRRRMALTNTVWPGWVGSEAGTVAVVLDSSGSIGQAELELFVGTMADLIEQVRPREIVVLDVDAEVHRARWLARGADLASIQREGVKGGGGTDMPAAFRWIDKEKLAPQCVVVLTDGYTPFGHDPGYPVLWAITEESIIAPWGISTHLQAA